MMNTLLLVDGAKIQIFSENENKSQFILYFAHLFVSLQRNKNLMLCTER